MKKPDAVGIVDLAQEVLKRLSKEMAQALPFRGQNSNMKQLLEWADNIRKSSMITDPTVQLQSVPEDEPMEDATDGAATGHSLEPFLSESVEAARPGLEQMTQLLRPDSDHDMASASSSRATAPTASRTTTHAQTRVQTHQQQLQQERADTER